MFARNRVIWNEGLFIKPQHFQQQQRYTEYLIDERIRAVSQYLYGVSELSLNPEYLSFGRIALERAVGIMPDGLAFRIPQEDVAPDALEIDDASLVNQIVYLSVPLRSDSLMEINWPQERGTGRYISQRLEVVDTHTVQGDTTTIDVSSVKMQLLLQKDDRSAYVSIAIARILEKRPDGSIVLDPDFIPCHYNVVGNTKLHRFINELSGMMRERAKTIANRISTPSQGGVADVSDFMLLQSLNRLQPQLLHLTELGSLHPERLFEYLSLVCGELSTFTDESRLPPSLPSYNHDMPSESFWSLIRYLRQSLSVVIDPRAVSIQLEKRSYGLIVAPIHDPTLIESGEFIISVKARVSQEELKRLFTKQTKVSSVEKIRELISLQLPGISLISLPVAPRQLPYHAGYIYYQLDKTCAAWGALTNSSGFAFHIAAAFEELDLQFWAIRD